MEVIAKSHAGMARARGRKLRGVVATTAVPNLVVEEMLGEPKRERRKLASDAW